MSNAMLISNCFKLFLTTISNNYKNQIAWFYKDRLKSNFSNLYENFFGIKIYRGNIFPAIKFQFSLIVLLQMVKKELQIKM